MGKLRRGFVVCSLIAALVFVPFEKAKAGPAREILLTSTYGVIAGSIVGLATIAFTGNPGGNLQNVAVGASVGLYVGIALGIYVAYGIPLVDGDEEGGKEGEGGGGDGGGGADQPKGQVDEGLLDKVNDDTDIGPDGEQLEKQLPEEPPEDAPDFQEGSLRRDQGWLVASNIRIQAPLVSVAPQWSPTAQKVGWMAYAQLVRVNF